MADTITVEFTAAETGFLILAFAYATWFEEAHENSVDLMGKWMSLRHKIADAIVAQKLETSHA